MKSSVVKKTAKQRMKSRDDRFVVGYIYHGNTLYGGRATESCSCMDPLSLSEAQQRLAAMPCPDCAIFELVPVEMNHKMFRDA